MISKRFLIIIFSLIIVLGISTAFFAEWSSVTGSQLPLENNNSQKIFPKSVFSFSELDMKTIDLSSIVVVKPYFTALAYGNHGFYEYFRNECSEECLTIQLTENVDLNGNSSLNAFQLFTSFIGFNSVTDLEIHNDPSILNSFDKVILLHNEYVTKIEFDAITNHPNVIYLYPNALYAEVDYDEQKKTISLVRGHGYPEADIQNGFDWKFENTHPYEYDTECENWEFYKIDNGYMLNCYPERQIFYDVKMLNAILEL